VVHAPCLPKLCSKPCNLRKSHKNLILRVLFFSFAIERSRAVRFHHFPLPNVLDLVVGVINVVKMYAYLSYCISVLLFVGCCFALSKLYTLYLNYIGPRNFFWRLESSFLLQLLFACHCVAVNLVRTSHIDTF